MRFLLPALLLALTSGVYAQDEPASTAEPDFRQSRWGDLRSAVQRTERGRSRIPYPGYIEYEARVFERPAEVEYTFAGDVLRGGSYTFDTNTRGETERLFDDIRAVLVTKYGDPTSCESIPGESYSDQDDARRCTWASERTEVSLRTAHSKPFDPGWHHAAVHYSPMDDAPYIEAGALREAPALFGQAVPDSTRALFGLRWGDSEAVVRRTLGAPLLAEDAGIGRSVLYQKRDIAGYQSDVLATFLGGGLQRLLVSAKHEYFYDEDYEFSVAMVRAILGEPTESGVPTNTSSPVDRIARWDTPGMTIALAFDKMEYEENTLTIVATSLGYEGAERREQRRLSSDF